MLTIIGAALTLIAAFFTVRCNRMGYLFSLAGNVCIFFGELPQKNYPILVLAAVFATLAAYGFVAWGRVKTHYYYANSWPENVPVPPRLFGVGARVIVVRHNQSGIVDVKYRNVKKDGRP